LTSSSATFAEKQQAVGQAKTALQQAAQSASGDLKPLLDKLSTDLQGFQDLLSSSPGPAKLASQVSLIVADISAITARCK
jgi:hypothetical protein